MANRFQLLICRNAISHSPFCLRSDWKRPYQGEAALFIRERTSRDSARLFCQAPPTARHPKVFIAWGYNKTTRCRSLLVQNSISGVKMGAKQVCHHYLKDAKRLPLWKALGAVKEKHVDASAIIWWNNVSKHLLAYPVHSSKKKKKSTQIRFSKATFQHPELKQCVNY